MVPASEHLRAKTPQEHGAVQLNVGQAHRRFNCNTASCICGSGQVDENGMYTGEFETFALAGFIRARGESDACSWCCTWPGF